jgi:hypothetical protein
MVNVWLNKCANFFEICAKYRAAVQYTHFTFHDLKRKGVTDTDGNKQDASGHRSAAMLNIYNVKPIIVKAAGEK